MVRYSSFQSSAFSVSVLSLSVGVYARRASSVSPSADVDKAPIPKPRLARVDHHPVFQHFQPQAPSVPNGYVQDSFLGTVRRNYVLQIEGYSDQDQDFLGSAMIDGESDEWIDLLESVLTACDVYTFMELRSRFWEVVSPSRCRRRSARGLSVNLVAVEPDIRTSCGCRTTSP